MTDKQRSRSERGAEHSRPVARKESTQSILRRFAPSDFAPSETLLEVARRRLGAIALTLLVMTVVTYPLRTVVVPVAPTYAPAALRDALVVAGIALDLALLFLAFKSRLSDRRVLDIGYFYEVLRAATLSFTPLPESGPPLMTWVCVLVVSFPLVLPTSDRRSTFVILIAASMQPLGLLTLGLLGYPVEPSAVFASLLSVTAAACFGLIGRDLMVRYQVEAERELGSYDLVERIGRGGMGEVWTARHRFLARPAAIKLIPPLPNASSKEVQKRVRRFRREAQVTANLTSPHTVAVYDFGVTDAGVYYYVMEHLSGLDLQQLVVREGRLPPGRAVFLAAQICDSLAEAHDAGLIHRDLKPSNVFVTRRGIEADYVKVLDFGLVGLLPPLYDQSIDVAITAGDMMTGTPAYMSPEMVRGTEIDGRADLYAVGCILFYMLTGELLFMGLAGTHLALAHAHEPPRDPREVVPDLDHELCRLVLECLDKDPARRPRTALELQTRLLSLSACGTWTRKDRLTWWNERFPHEAADEMKSAVRRGEESGD